MRAKQINALKCESRLRFNLVCDSMMSSIHDNRVCLGVIAVPPTICKLKDWDSLRAGHELYLIPFCGWDSDIISLYSRYFSIIIRSIFLLTLALVIMKYGYTIAETLNSITLSMKS